jgi:hypothetical protein
MSVSRVTATLLLVFTLAQRVSPYTSSVQVVTTNIQNTPIRVTVRRERGQKHFQVFVILDSWGVGWRTNVTFKGWLDGQWLSPDFIPAGQQHETRASKPDAQAVFDFVVATAPVSQKKFMVCVYGKSRGEPENMRIPYMEWWFYLSDFAGG